MMTVIGSVIRRLRRLHTLSFIVKCGVCIACANPFVSFSGTAGKIKGTVTDRQSGEPLIGSTVVVVGTSLGASANIDGEYIILNVPPGTYELEAKFIGYQVQKIGNVQISSDLTTEVNIRLTPLQEGVAMAEIVVQRERELVNKNATNAVRIQTQEDVKNLPVRGVTAAIALNPGIVQQNGDIFIRGGRRAEVGYYLEGASTRNVLDGTNITTVIPEALEEFQVQAGGYNAQYGGANSGIIRQTLRSGTPDFHVNLSAETDNFTKQNQKALNTYSYGYSNYVLTLSGPLFSDKLKFFVAGENQFDRDFRVQFWEGFRFENLADSRSSDTVRALEVNSGNVPGMGRNRYTLNGTVTVDVNPVILRFGGSITRQRQQGTTVPVLYNLFTLDRLPITESSDVLINSKLTHFLSPTVLYEVNFNYSDRRTKRFDPDHGDNYLLYSDSIANAQYGYQYRSYTSGPFAYLLYGFPFNRFGTQLSDFNKTFQRKLGGTIDLTAQLGSVHEFKFGGSVETYLVRNFDTGVNGLSSLLLYYRNNPDVARTPGTARDYQVRRNGAINNYGYDVYGNILNSGIDGPKKPIYWAAYIQDKIEYSDLVINAGLRFDLFDNDDFKFIDDPTTPGVIEGPDNPSVDPTTFEYKETGIQKRKAFAAVSPRLGFSFPVSDRTVFHLQFGKFIQAPRLDQLYTGRGNQGVTFSGGNYIPNPVGFDLDPERTTSYEVGFTQQFSDVAAFDITAYYKDISGQIQLVRQNTTATSVAAGYNTLANGDFATTKGFELSFTLRRTNRVQARANYTFADAKGTGSANNSSVSSIENGTLTPTVISPLDFNQTHRGSINLDYRFGENDGGPILERLGVNLLFTFNSGHPFTQSAGSPGQQGAELGALIENDARFSNPLEPVNISTTPWNFNIDLRIDKSLQLGPLNTNLYVYIQNLLNTKNVINVYRRSGNADDDGYLTNPTLSGSVIASNGPRYVELYRAINLGLGQHYRWVTGNDLWGSPRQIRFGIKLEY